MRLKIFFVIIVAVAVVAIAFATFNNRVVTVRSDTALVNTSGTVASGTNTSQSTTTGGSSPTTGSATATGAITTIYPPLATITFDPNNTAAYDAKALAIANLPIVKRTVKVSSTVMNASGTPVVVWKSVVTTSTAKTGWPVTTAPYPLAGALLPFNRIVAYYGNFYSTQMGVLGQYPANEMIAMLASTTAEWAAADPATPVIPALDYIAVTAQGSAGKDGMYRLRMPDDQIDKALNLIAPMHGIVFLDVQVGLSNVETEVPLLEKYLAMPNVELSLDPEFDMTTAKRPPGTVIGTMDAADINFAANYLAGLVREHNLPPKILVVHRFTEEMVTNYRAIKPLPEVQVVMDMDGFGFPAKKINTYQQVIIPEPVQFTGFKLFYKNDAAGPYGHLMAPSEVLELSPNPNYIQYQ